VSHGSVAELRWDYAAWGIDLVVAGDDHIFERATHDGVVYVVNGLGGVETHDVSEPIEGSEVLYNETFGALFVSVGNGGASAAFVDVDGAVVDRFVLDGGPLPPQRPATTGRLGVDTTWQWQLQGEIDTSYDVDLYDVDLFETPDATIAELRDAGRIVICYFSAGSYEAWRPDADEFAPGDLGATLDGFDDERWLDVRSPNVRDVVAGRLDLAAARGCDGVEPDNVDGDDNDTGFDLTSDDLYDFNRFIAAAAAERDLLVGLKNNLGLIPDLVDDFDFAVNEQCHEFGECDAYEPFLTAGKPVFNAEYAARFVDDADEMCAASRALGLRTLVLDIDLDNSTRISCDPT
jgi:hypothetical protein